MCDFTAEKQTLSYRRTVFFGVIFSKNKTIRFSDKMSAEQKANSKKNVDFYIVMRYIKCYTTIRC